MKILVLLFNILSIILFRCRRKKRNNHAKHRFSEKKWVIINHMKIMIKILILYAYKRDNYQDMSIYPYFLWLLTNWYFQKFKQLKIWVFKKCWRLWKEKTNSNMVLNFINTLHNKLLGTLKIPENQLELEQLELQNKRRWNSILLNSSLREPFSSYRQFGKLTPEQEKWLIREQSSLSKYI